MADSDIPWIKISADKLGALIRKPKLAAKLLGRPPVRYIRDIIVNVIKATGFPAGLYPPETLNADGQTIKKWSRDDKIGFLNRLHKCVEVATGTQIQFKGEKASQGQEPENTNAVFQGLADAGQLLLSGQIDMDSVLAKLDGGGGGGREGKRPQADAEAEEAKAREAEERIKAKEDEERRRAAAAAAKAEERAKALEIKKAERDRRQAAEAAATRGGGSNGVPESLEEAVAITKSLLGDLIRKPTLSDKHLSRPPIRYLHDITINLIQNTGFLNGLFSPEELDPKVFKTADRRTKGMFIKKLLRFASAAINKPLEAKVKDIMGGMEPLNTNLLLHALAQGANDNISSDTITNRISGRDRSPATRSNREPSPATAAGGGERPGRRRSRPPAEKRPEAGEAVGRGGMEDALKALALNAADKGGVGLTMPKLDIGNIPANPSKPPEEATSAYHAETAAAAAAEETAKAMRPTTRPMTARRAPPKVRSHLVEEKKKRIADNDAASTGLITEDNMGETDDEDEEEDDEKEDDIMEGVLDKDGHHGKLVSDILKFQGKHQVHSQGEEEGKTEGGSQFRFGRLKKSKNSNANFYSNEQIIFLRSKIQQLCQSATPLGKCIDFVCEDMESMNKELAQWKRQYESECGMMQGESKKTHETIGPLLDQVKKLDEEIAVERQTTVRLQAQILRNEKMIQAHLKNQSGM